MAGSYQKGVAFIFEGPTEKVFYSVLLDFFCKKHPGSQLEKKVNPKTGEIFYELKNDATSILVKMNTVGTISQITNSCAWFSTKCHAENKDLDWTVVLCYDTDEYQSSFSKFQKDDWDILRKSLKKNNAKEIIDMASSADIEDTMLLDSDSVFQFLGLTNQIVPSGGKGKSKMKQIFRMKGRGVAYHSGDRARPLIEALDLDKIIQLSPLPFDNLEQACFVEK